MGRTVGAHTSGTSSAPPKSERTSGKRLGCMLSRPKGAHGGRRARRTQRTFFAARPGDGCTRRRPDPSLDGFFVAGALALNQSPAWAPRKCADLGPPRSCRRRSGSHKQHRSHKLAMIVKTCVRVRGQS